MSKSVSSKPGKVRKRQMAPPLHKRSGRLSAHLSSDLIDKFGTRSMIVRVGDKVMVMRGDHVGHEDDVSEVDPDEGVVYVKDVTQDKADGTKSFIPVRASNVTITNLNLDDERRQKIMQRRGMP
jgi:large subunit ribosomal protein L24